MLKNASDVQGGRQHKKDTFLCVLKQGAAEKGGDKIIMVQKPVEIFFKIRPVRDDIDHKVVGFRQDGAGGLRGKDT